MRSKNKQEYKVLVTKEKLLNYIKILEVIKVVPVKDEEPILILKTLRPGYGLLGVPDEVVIHKGYFILSRGVERVESGSKNVSCLIPAKVTYPDKFETSHPPKELLIKSVLDNEIPISNTIYVRPVKELLRKYGILPEKRGTGKIIKNEVKERNRIIVEEYLATKRKRPFPIKKIQDRLSREIRKDTNLGKIFAINDLTVRRVIKSYIKKMEI